MTLKYCKIYLVKRSFRYYRKSKRCVNIVVYIFDPFEQNRFALYLFVANFLHINVHFTFIMLMLRTQNSAPISIKILIFSIIFQLQFTF